VKTTLDYTFSVHESAAPRVLSPDENARMQPVKLLFGMGLTAMAFAQPPINSPAFDVASVRRNDTGINGSSISRSGGRITLDNVSLRECIMFAYSIPTGREYALVGPGWLDSEKFDIVATFPSATSRELVRMMLQNLLAERFSMKAHQESRNVNAYVLVRAKGGPKLGQSPGNDDDGAFTFQEGRVTCRTISMESFADRLSGSVFHLDRPVIDKTGIVGNYDFTLEWAPDGAPPDQRSGPSLFTALQEQLGLRLEARKIATGILVIDHLDRVPAGN
jgi:uncharacterized protein (TIGR03435 family)